jgi:hypothetical protein
MKICKHQIYCKYFHEYIDCPQEGCIWGCCDTCNVYYNPLLPDGEELPEALKGKT